MKQISIRKQVLRRDRFTCLYCGCKVEPRQWKRSDVDPKRATLDHLIPKSEGGRNTIDNLVTACADCNLRRQSRPVEEFASPEALARIREVAGIAV